MAQTEKASEPDGRWVGCRPNFFLPVCILSRLYRRLFLQRLQAALGGGKLEFFGALTRLREPTPFVRHLAALREVEWVVYAKRPFAGPSKSVIALTPTCLRFSPRWMVNSLTPPDGEFPTHGARYANLTVAAELRRLFTAK